MYLSISLFRAFFFPLSFYQLLSMKMKKVAVDFCQYCCFIIVYLLYVDKIKLITNDRILKIIQLISKYFWRNSLTDSAHSLTVYAAFQCTRQFHFPFFGFYTILPEMQVRSFYFLIKTTKHQSSITTTCKSLHTASKQTVIKVPVFLLVD